MKRRFFLVLMTMFITIVLLNGCNTNKEIKDDEQNQTKQEIQFLFTGTPKAGWVRARSCAAG